MVRTSFLKIIKAVKLYCSVLKNSRREPKDDTFLKVLRSAEGPHFALTAAIETNNVLPKCLIAQYANLALMPKERVDWSTNAE